MSKTTTLSRLILKEYNRSFYDFRTFEWVYLEGVDTLISLVTPVEQELTEIGAWIYPIEVEKLQEVCRDQIEDDGEYFREALSIAVLAGWRELGPAIAAVADAEDGSLSRIVACARAAELLGAFSPGILEVIREIPENAGEEEYEEDKTIDTSACLLVRYGTENDREYVKNFVEEEESTPVSSMLLALCDAGFDMAEEFEILQRGSFPPPHARNIDLFCEIAAKTDVPIDFAQLLTADEPDWIGGILTRMLRSPSEFVAQRKGLRKTFQELNGQTEHGALALVVLTRLGENADLLRSYAAKATEYEERGAVHIAMIDGHAGEDEDDDVRGVDQFLAAGCRPDTPPADLRLLNIITKEELFETLLLDDPRLRAPRESYTGLFQAAAAGEELTDQETALLIAAIGQDGYWGEPLGRTVYFDRRPRDDGFESRLFSVILKWGGPETRALLAHRLLMPEEHHLEFINTLLVLLAYLDGSQSWIEPTLVRFYGIEQEGEEKWLAGDTALIIESLENPYRFHITSIALSMPETELRRRPGLVSHMWNNADPRLWKRAWQVASEPPGAHPFLSPPAEAASVALAHTLVCDQFVAENWEDVQPILSRIQPESGWPEALERLIRWRETEWRVSVGR